MDIGEIIKKRRNELNISVDELANLIGKNRATIYRYENSQIENLPANILEPLSIALAITPDELLGSTNSSVKGTKIPVLGTVAAGIPIEAIEDIEDYEEIPEIMARQGDYFALKIKGASMEPKFSEGDVIIVRKQSYVDSGEIGVILVNGNDATVKRVIKQDAGIMLVATNQDVYPPRFYSNSDIKSLPIQILGKVVELRAKF